MRKLTSILIVLAFFFSTSSPAFGWGDDGHKTVGQIAQMFLQGTPTLDKIKAILRPGESLSSIATWADRVKNEDSFNPTATSPDPDTQDFFRHMANQHNRNWHFVDLPLDCASYNACHEFNLSSDIVHIINKCILKLRGGNVPNLTKRNALRLIAHLVGDLHQPLHVGVGFVNVVSQHDIRIETNPQTILANDFPSDRGANRLLISGEDADNLHSFWDSALVDEAMNGQSVTQFATMLKQQFPPTPDWNASGTATTWAAQWAGDTLKFSKANAYKSVVLKKVVVINDDTKYRSEFGSNYKSDNVPVVRLQLAKGGYRLARLLQAIFQ